MQDKDFIKPSEPSYYPSIFASPDEKSTKRYALATAKAIYWNNYTITQNAFGNNARSRWIDNRNWSNGRFDVTAFVGGKKQKNHRDKNPLFKNLDFDPVTEMPKYRDIVVGYLEELDFEVIASTINPIAKAKKEDARMRELALLKMRQSGMADYLNKLAGRNLTGNSTLPFQPETQEEIDMYFLLGGFKEMAELEIELGNEIVQNDSKWRFIKKQLLEDAFDIGRMAIDIEYDKAGRLKYKYIDPINCGVEDYRGHYLQRPNRIWYIDTMTVHEIIMDSQGQIGIKEAEQIAKTYENRFGNPTWQQSYDGYQNYVNTDTTYAYYWYNYKVPVMKCYWEELDIYKNESVEKFGKKIVKPTSFDAYTEKYQNTGAKTTPPVESIREVNQYAVHNYYTTKWIINTDHVWDNGKVPFQTRDPFDVKYALCPLKYYRIAHQPPAERVKAFAKKIYMTWQKIDQEVSNKIPSGYKINVRALENISLGQGEQFTVKHAIELVNETGRLVYADEALADDFGRTIKKDPIETFDTSTPFLRAIQAWIQLIQFYEDRIIKVTGLNEFIDSSNPNTQAAASVAKLAAQGAKNSFSQMASGLLGMCEQMSIDVSERLRLLVQYQGEYNGYADALGNGLLQAQAVSKAVVPHKFGIKVQAKPTAAEREQLNQAIYQAFSNMASPENGGLWVSAAVRYQQLNAAGVNMKLIRIMMEAEQRKALKAVNETRLEAIDRQAQANMQNMDAASQAELQKYAAEKKIDLLYEMGMTSELRKREMANINDKAAAKVYTDSHKSNLKIQEKQADNVFGLK